jgi:hypothetical protein
VRRLALGHTGIEGTWPDVATQTPVAEVAVCHHVVYNVADLAAFAQALTDHASARIVIERAQSFGVTGDPRTRPAAVPSRRGGALAG